MSEPEGGAVPDDVIEAVAQALRTEGREQDERDDPHAIYDYWPDMARAALSVPSVAEVFARDAKVREIMREWRAIANTAPHVDIAGAINEHVNTLAALYLEAQR